MSIRPTPLAEIGMRPDAGWRTHRAVLRAKRAWPFEARCLQTALTMQAVLRHHGLNAPVRVGVRAEDGELRAHAWVELANGHMLDDGPGGRDFELLPATRASAPDGPREGPREGSTR